MKNEPLEVIRGSGNVFRDFGHDNADVEQFKALLAAEIIKALDRDKLLFHRGEPFLHLDLESLKVRRHNILKCFAYILDRAHVSLLRAL